MREYTLQIGEQAHLRKAAFRASYAVVYAGMLSADIFSPGITYNYGYQASGFNLFVPNDQREVRYMQWRITILDVRPDQIRMRIEKA